MARAFEVLALLGLASANGWRTAPRVPSSTLVARRCASASRVVASDASPGAAIPARPRTLSDCERAFDALYGKPVYPPYSSLVDEVFSSLTLTLSDGRFDYSHLFALGLDTILEEGLVVQPTLEQGVECRVPNRALATAVCGALGLEYDTIERDADSVRAWATGLKESDILALISSDYEGMPPGTADGDAAVDIPPTTEAAEVDRDRIGDTPGEGAGEGSRVGVRSRLRSFFKRGQRSEQVPSSEAARELRALAEDKYPFYHLCIGLALGQLVDTVEARPRGEALERWADALGIKSAKLKRDCDWFVTTMDKIYDVEERRMEDEVRKMRKRAASLRAEADEAKRVADQAEGIVPSPAAEDEESVSPEESEARAAAEAQLGEALADMEKGGTRAAEQDSSTK